MYSVCQLVLRSIVSIYILFFFFFQAEDGIRDVAVTGVQTCALPIYVDVTGSSNTFTLDTGTSALSENLDLDWIINGDSKIGRASCRERV